MSVRYGTYYDTARMRTYAEAEEYLARTKPYAKGEWAGRWPLTTRAHTHRNVARRATGEIDVYIGGSSPLITLHPDGRIGLWVPKWSQKSTEGDFIGRVLGWDWKSFDSRFWVWTRDGWGSVHVVDGGEQAKFRMDTATNRPVPEEGTITRNTTYTVNRETIKLGRRTYAGFLKYAQAMHKVQEWTDTNRYNIITTLAAFDPEEAERTGNVRRRYDNVGTFARSSQGKAVELLANMRSDDPTRRYAAYRQFIFRDAGWITGASQSVWVHPMDVFPTLLTRLLLVAEPELYLTRVDHTDGKLHANKYSWAAIPIA